VPDSVVENDGGVGAASVFVVCLGGRSILVGAGSCGLAGKPVVFWVAFQAQANMASEGSPSREHGRAKSVNVGDGVGALAAEKAGKGVGGEAPVGEGGSPMASVISGQRVENKEPLVVTDVRGDFWVYVRAVQYEVVGG
jgi:hypothetical protein